MSAGAIIRPHLKSIKRGMLLVPGLVLFTLIVLAPLFALFLRSITEANPAAGMAAAWTPDNYTRFFSDPFFLSVLARTYRVAAIVVAICLVIGWPVAYQLSKTQGRARLYLSLIVMVPLLISVVVRTFGWVVILGPQGLVNSSLQWLGLIDAPLRLLFSETAVVIGAVHTFLPLMVLPIASALDNVDPSLVRAGRNLGATGRQIFVRVLFPLSMPGVLAGSLIIFALCSSAYVTPALLGGARLRFMSTLIYEYNIVVLDWSFGSALSVILVALTIAIVALYSRFIERIAFRGVFQR
ncbi:ABC transporter permease [Bosea sp. (in: a-proteobacteria)]|uniref:ABC transporter permease n=1 Tax=Bosea sp. (in: a-proteobacteria) TaxID=1871050 RepID=UPI002611B86A|nr:ABC transporter permease [Bosea sp. (in: a-proteobacteria)]MCO5089577.1 ABC transporter permease [Bosea sp. (in: a-proteobacteria)]